MKLPSSTGHQILAGRIKPGRDLKLTLLDIVQSHQLSAGWMVSCVGSLKNARLRMAGGIDILEREGPFEILSLSGTLGLERLHLHMTLSDNEGRCLGGHLLDGCKIFTTCEVVLGLSSEIAFTRVQDADTGYGELMVESCKGYKSWFEKCLSTMRSSTRLRRRRRRGNSDQQMAGETSTSLMRSFLAMAK